LKSFELIDDPSGYKLLPYKIELVPAPPYYDGEIDYTICGI